MDRVLQHGTPEDLMRLFDNGVSIDQEDWEGRTALMLMVAKDQRETVELLLERGANVNHIFNYQGRIPMTSLDAARQTKNFALADLLISYGAKTGRELQNSQPS